MQACDRCHARKTRCDRRIPQCSACEKASVPCLHADKLRQRNVPRGYIDSMETTVKQLSEENRRLRRSLASLSSRTESTPPAFIPTPASTSTLDDLVPFQVQCSATDETTRVEMSPNTSYYQQTPGDSSNSTTSASSKASPTGDLFAQEVGFLSLIASGETRYLGPSSGMGLASLLSNVVDTQGVMNSLSFELGSSDGCTTGSTNILSVDTTIPAAVVAMPLIEAYFQHAHITFPLLHRPSFMTTVDRIYADPEYYSANTFDAFTFDMVLAIGGSNLNRFDEPTAGASRYYSMAQSKLGTIMNMDRLTTLKAILLMSQHGIFSSVRDTSASIWHLIGFGARICFELGLHVEPRYGNASKYASVVTMEQEMKRRCFWCLYNLDRVVSCTLGRPVVIRDEEIDVSLPSHLDDDSFGLHHPIESNHQAGTPSAPNYSPFLHLIRIRRLSGQILSTFYNSRHSSTVSIEEKKCIRQKFQDELDTWKFETEHLALYPEMQSRGQISSFLTPDWYNALYNNAILLLYRPSPYLPHPTLIAEHANGESDIMKLLNAAKGSIESYSRLHQRRRLNYSWITLHAVFVAGLAYVYSVGRVLRDSRARHLIPDLLSVIELTRTCSNILVAICERWSTSRQCCEIFNKLSNALIRDVLNLTGQEREQKIEASSSPCVASEVLMSQQPALGFNQIDEVTHRDSLLQPNPLGTASELEDILVMDEFRQFAGSIVNSIQGEGSLPTELTSGFSHDWPFDVPCSSRGELETSIQAVSAAW